MHLNVALHYRFSSLKVTQSIFISYRRSDTGGHTGRLYDRLRQWFGADELFLDVSTLETGDVFPERIDRAIRGAKAVLVIVGPDWLEMLNDRVAHPKVDFVRREVAIAIERQAKGETVVLPALVGGAAIPSREDLNIQLREELGRLLDIHAHEFPSDQALWDFQFERLRQRLSSVAGVPTPHYPLVIGNESPQTSVDQVPIPNSPTVVPTRRPLPLFNSNEIEKCFHSVSRALLDWPQETEGQWIERPELEQLYALTAQGKPAVTVLLGPPGEGKSAILARLGARLSGEGVALLAIKADRMPLNVTTHTDLDAWVGCAIPVAEALRERTRERRVVLLIDQLDALADLMDRRSERLSVLLRLVNTLRDTPNLQVLVSCREFEFHNDVRLSTLKRRESLT